MANPILSGLTAYVEEHKLPLLAKSVLGAKSIKHLTLYGGIKGATALNLISTDVVFGDANECHFSPEGTSEITQRVITPAYLKVDAAYCDKVMRNYWMNNQIKIASGEKVLPFEEEFVDGIVNGIQEKLETMVWQGDSDNDNEFDGLLKVLADAPTATTNSSAYEAIKNVYMALPANVVDKADTVIFVGNDTYRQFIQELVEANLYHYDPANGADGYKLPGTDVTVLGVNGLNATKKIVGARKSNLFYGTDMTGDSEHIDLWYSKDYKEFRLSAEWLSGVQVAYPNEVVTGGIA